MEKVLDLIDSKDGIRLKEWMNTLDSNHITESTYNDLLYVAERLSSIAFSGDAPNLTFAQLTSELYEKIYCIKPSSESALISSTYIRLRVLKESPVNKLNSFFLPSAILQIIRLKFDLPFNEIQDRAVNWRTLKLDEIIQLRSLKMWLKLLLELENIEGKEYSEFTEWKSIYTVLP